MRNFTIEDVLDIVTSADGDYDDYLDAKVSAGHDGKTAIIKLSRPDDGIEEVFSVVVGEVTS